MGRECLQREVEPVCVVEQFVWRVGREGVGMGRGSLKGTAQGKGGVGPQIGGEGVLQSDRVQERGQGSEEDEEG